MAGDVLSQAEIDSLLSSLSTGTVSADKLKEGDGGRKVKTYDFKRPDKFSKDQMRTLFMLHENFARLLNTYLSTNLRTIVQIDVASVDQLTYQEFIQSVPNPSVIGVFQMRPLKGNAILDINTNLMLSLIDRLFGGP
ncbi:MAG: flagellar motor switch protein FliM, partial [Sporomusaceae bacterium]|nr:flagellar motor switch protein FliM [Sporomusaceae bacterium]